MSRVPTGLSRLNETEERVLRLLAEGHTAKSIATELGVTPAAVNERLREARRKTGVGSSRELARLLKAQESRDEQLGVASALPLESHQRSVGGRLIRSDWKGPIAMTLALITALGAAALAFQQPNADADHSSGSTASDPLFASIFAERDPTLFANQPKTEGEIDNVLAGEGFRAVLRQLHAKVHSESRDASWAPETENAIRRVFTSIPHVGEEGAELRVLCGSTLCEIAGTVETPATSGAAVLDDFNRSTMSRLNPKALEPKTDRLRLKSLWAGIGQMSENPPRLSYIFYYSRAVAQPK